MEEQAPYITNRPIPVIDSKELRIGNLIKARDINQFRIDEICLSEYGEYIFRMYPAFPDKRSCIHLPAYMAEPITLTKETLLKMGFEKNPMDDEFYYSYYSYGLNKDRYCDLSLVSGDKNDYLDVVLFPYEEWFRYKYVHQLQNIYFALTGKELEIKL